MKIHQYKTAGGKDVIDEYILSLSHDERRDGHSVIKAFEENRIDEVRSKLWRGKIWEVYFYRDNRLFYVVVDNEDAYFIHACRKQKNKTEKQDSKIVVQRAKDLGRELLKKFI